MWRFNGQSLGAGSSSSERAGERAGPVSTIQLAKQAQGEAIAAWVAETAPAPGGRRRLLAAAAPGLVGVRVADLEPDRDPDGSYTRRMVAFLGELLGIGKNGGVHGVESP